MLFLCVRRAFFRADATEEVYVELPPELRVDGEDSVALLRKWM